MTFPSEQRALDTHFSNLKGNGGEERKKIKEEERRPYQIFMEP